MTIQNRTIIDVFDHVPNLFYEMGQWLEIRDLAALRGVCHPLRALVDKPHELLAKPFRSLIGPSYNEEITLLKNYTIFALHSKHEITNNKFLPPPRDMTELLSSPTLPTLPTVAQLKTMQSFITAVDIFKVWCTLINTVDLPKHPSKVFESTATYIETARGFGKWIKDNASSLQQINRLGYSCFGLKSLPGKIAKLTNLKILYLSENKLREIPKEIGKLTHLKILNLSHNKLREIPKEIGKLTHLTSLNLSHNKLREIPKEIGKLTHLTFLNLFNNNLQSLPKEIGKLTKLTFLEISNNKLREIPKEIGKLKKLEILGLSNHELREIPKEIGKLKKLEILDLSNNKLKQIPKEIGKLTKLKRLNLSNNKLREIPKEIENLTKLIELNLSNNKLKEFSIGMLEKLRKLSFLSLHGNPLEAYPSLSIKQLYALKSFDLSNTPVANRYHFKTLLFYTAPKLVANVYHHNRFRCKQLGLALIGSAISYPFLLNDITTIAGTSQFVGQVALFILGIDCCST